MDDRQHWQAARYADNARFVADLGRPVVELLAPRPGERILDLGCGDGALTETLVAAGARVVGIDASASMIEAARARGLDARLMDGLALDVTALTANGPFDAVFSNAALHWMRRPEVVIAGVAALLRPGGRFVGEFGGHGNVAAICTAIVAVLERRRLDGAALLPWYYPTPVAYARLLAEAGFTVEQIGLIPRPTPLPTGIAGWLATFVGGIVEHLPKPERADALEEIEHLLRWSLCDEDGNWHADYVRLRFRAVSASSGPRGDETRF